MPPSARSRPQEAVSAPVPQREGPLSADRRVEAVSRGELRDLRAAVADFGTGPLPGRGGDGSRRLVVAKLGM